MPVFVIKVVANSQMTTKRSAAEALEAAVLLSSCHNNGPVRVYGTSYDGGMERKPLATVVAGDGFSSHGR